MRKMALLLVVGGGFAGILLLGLVLNAGSAGRAVLAGSAADTAAVDISGFAYDPSPITVTVGTTITWTNQDPVPHTVTGSGWDSGSIPQSGTYSRVFTTTGTFDYICTIHPGMSGRVVVEEAVVLDQFNYLPVLLDPEPVMGPTPSAGSR